MSIDHYLSGSFSIMWGRRELRVSTLKPRRLHHVHLNQTPFQGLQEKQDDNPHLSSSRHILPLQSHPRVYIDSRPPRPHVLLNGSTMSCNLHIRGGSKSYVQGSIDVFIISSPPSQALPLASHQLAQLQLPGLSIGVCPP